jgi:DNA-binding transcriptional LysR family regulator
MRMLNLTQLNHLVALADECHFARAADRVYLSQPAFSRSIQAIERSVDMRLFERQSRDVRPTPAGLFLIERARRLLSDARNVERDVGLYRDAKLGDTAFGVGPFPAATMVPKVLAAMRLAHPDVALRVEVDNWKQLLHALVREDIEFFVADTRDVGGDPALEILPLGRQQGVFCVRPGHPLAGQQPSFAQLWSYGVAATKLPQAIKQALGPLLGLPLGELPRLLLECDDVKLLHTIARTTDTVVATTQNAVDGEADEAGAVALVPVQVQGLPPLFAEMGVVRLRNRTPSPMSEKVVAAIFALSQLR